MLPRGTAGALVFAKEHRTRLLLTFQHERGQWELPKGGPENAEISWEQVAIREVKEETGIDIRDQVLVPLVSSHQDIRHGRGRWFGVRHEGKVATIPDAKWITYEEIGMSIQRDDHRRLAWEFWP